MPNTLAMGSEGPAVRELQGNLKQHGIDVKIDGRFGPATKEAVKKFQAGAHIGADGIAGQKTWQALHKEDKSGGHHGKEDFFSHVEIDMWIKQMLAAARSNMTPAKPSIPTLPGLQVPLTKTKPTPTPTSPTGQQKDKLPSFVTPSTTRSFTRVSFNGYEGNAWVLRGFEQYEGHQVQLSGERTIRKFAATPPLKNECAQFVQLFGVPLTKHWRKGPQVCHMKAGEIPIGTVIATLRDDKYYSDYSGRSHVGIYLGHDDYVDGKSKGGVHIMDQWNGAAIARRTKLYAVDGNKMGNTSKKAWTDSAGNKQTKRTSWISDGEEYFVLMTAI